jgi:hypothetical protein
MSAIGKLEVNCFWLCPRAHNRSLAQCFQQMQQFIQLFDDTAGANKFTHFSRQRTLSLFRCHGKILPLIQRNGVVLICGFNGKFLRQIFMFGC